MWDPEKYLAFADHRSRPFHELVARVRATSPRRVVDLGCGPGHLTETLARRWPEAAIEALDSSPEMVAAARERGIDANVGDITQWKPRPDTDVVVTNAVLHWVPGHDEVLRRWARELPSGAWIAMQVPGNFDAASHSLARELISESWQEKLGDVVLREDEAIFSPEQYADILGDCEVDAWETTYVQQLTGQDAVLEWITGSALRPVRAALTEDEWQRFRAELAPRLREAYPRRADGRTFFPFRRVFTVARVP